MEVEWEYADPEEPTFEKFLCDSEDEGGSPDKAGYTGYSIVLQLDQNRERIVEIERIGHCHMCGGQGADYPLARFPHQLVEEAAREIQAIIREKRDG